MARSCGAGALVHMLSVEEGNGRSSGEFYF